MRTHFTRIIALLLLSASFVGCSSYLTPGGPADLSAFTEPSVADAASARPAVKFPAALVVTRVQEPGYRNENIESYGTGRYSIVTTREVEKEQDIDRLSKLPGVSQIGTLNRLLLPQNLDSEVALRQGAAKLHADLLLIYTFTTAFRDKDKLPPLTVLTLGLSPTKSYRVTSSAAAIVVDVKTGYVYGALEEVGDEEGLTIAWNSRSALDSARKKAEREAFRKLLTRLESFWPRFYERYN